MNKEFNGLKRTLQYTMLFVRQNRDLMHDSIDIEIYDLIAGAIKELDEIKRKYNQKNKELLEKLKKN